MSTKLPIGWAKCLLRDIAWMIRERSKPQEYPDLDFIGMDDVEAHTMRVLSKKPSSALKSTATHFYCRDILYGRLRPYLNKVFLAEFEGLASAEFIPLTAPAGIIPKFILYRLNSSEFVSFASHLNEGDRPRVDYQQISEFGICLPPTNEQHRIVAKIKQLFSALDKGVAELKAAKKKLELYRQSLLKAAFEGRLTEQWRRDHADELESTEELLARIKAEREKRYQQQLEEWQQAVKKWEADGKPGKKPRKPRKPKELPPLTEEELAQLPKLPEGWVWGYSEWAGDIETGTTPSKKHPEYYGSKFPFFKPTDLEAGYEVTEAREYLSSKGIKYARLLPVNSILVTSIGATIGKTGIIRCAGASNQQINAIIPIDSSNPNYVYWQTVGPLFQKELKKQASSTTMPIINKSKFALLHFAFCSKSEQDKITQLLEKAFASINHLTQTIDQALSQADLLRQAILKKAFSGQLVPQDPNDEPASELLKRIKAEREAVKAGQRGQRGRSGPGQRKGQGGQRRKARG